MPRFCVCCLYILTSVRLVTVTAHQRKMLIIYCKIDSNHVARYYRREKLEKSQMRRGKRSELKRNLPGIRFRMAQNIQAKQEHML